MKIRWILGVFSLVIWAGMGAASVPSSPPMASTVTIQQTSGSNDPPISDVTVHPFS